MPLIESAFLGEISDMDKRKNQVINARTVDILERLSSAPEAGASEIPNVVRGVVGNDLKRVLADIYFFSPNGTIERERVAPINEAFRGVLADSGIKSRVDAERAEMVLRLRGYGHDVKDETTDSYASILVEPTYQNQVVPVVMVAGHGANFQKKKSPNELRKTGPMPSKFFPATLFGEDGSVEKFDEVLRGKVEKALSALGITNWQSLVAGPNNSSKLMEAIRGEFVEFGGVNRPEYQMLKAKANRYFFNGYYRKTMRGENANPEVTRDPSLVVDAKTADEMARRELADFVFGPQIG